MDVVKIEGMMKEFLGDSSNIYSKPVGDDGTCIRGDFYHSTGRTNYWIQEHEKVFMLKLGYYPMGVDLTMPKSFTPAQIEKSLAVLLNAHITLQVISEWNSGLSSGLPCSETTEGVTDE